METRLKILLYNSIDYMIQEGLSKDEIKDYLGMSEEEFNLIMNN